MEEKELIEKLKNISRINIESVSHRARLRFALLQSHEKIQKSQKISAFAWKIIPVSAFALMFLVLGFSQGPTPVLKNMNTVSEVKQILQNDKQAKLLIISGAIIENTKITGERAYVTMRLPKEVIIESKAAGEIIADAPKVSGALNYQRVSPEAVDEEFSIEVDLINKKVISVREKTKQKEALPNK